MLARGMQANPEISQQGQPTTQQLLSMGGWAPAYHTEGQGQGARAGGHQSPEGGEAPETRVYAPPLRHGTVGSQLGLRCFRLGDPMTLRACREVGSCADEGPQLSGAEQGMRTELCEG